MITHLVLAIDPITLGGLALGLAGGLAGGGLFGGGGGSSAPPPAPAAPATPAPAQSPTGTPKGKGGAMTPSFIGAAAAPDQKGFGAKTLIGQ